MPSSTNIIWCPRCEKQYRVPDNAGGKTLRCKKCKFAFLISDALNIDPVLAKKTVSEVMTPRVAAVSKAEPDAVEEPLPENDFDDILAALDNPNSARTKQEADEDKGPPPRAFSKRGRPNSGKAQTQPRRTRSVAATRSASGQNDEASNVTDEAYEKNRKSRRRWVLVATLFSLLLGAASAYWMYARPVSMLSETEFSILRAIGIPPAWIADGASSDSTALAAGDDGGEAAATIRLKNEFSHLASKPPRGPASNNRNEVAGTPFDPLGGAGDGAGQPNDDGEDNAADRNRDDVAANNAERMRNRGPGADVQGGPDGRPPGRGPAAGLDRGQRPQGGHPLAGRNDGPIGGGNGLANGNDRRQIDRGAPPEPGANRNQFAGNNPKQPNMNRPDGARPGGARRGGGRPAIPGPGERNGQSNDVNPNDEELAASRGVDPKIVSQFKTIQQPTRFFALSDDIIALLESPEVIRVMNWRTKKKIGIAGVAGNATGIAVSGVANGEHEIWVSTSLGNLEFWRQTDAGLELEGKHRTGFRSVVELSGIKLTGLSIVAIANGQNVKCLRVDGGGVAQIEEIPADTFENQVMAVRVSADGNKVLASDGVRWMIADSFLANPMIKENLPLNGVRSMDFSPDGSLAAVTNGKQVAVFNSNDGTVLKKIDLARSDEVRFSSDGSLLVLNQGLIHQYQPKTLRLTNRYWATGTGKFSKFGATGKHLFAVDGSIGELGIVFELDEAKKSVAAGANVNRSGNRGARGGDLDSRMGAAAKGKSKQKRVVTPIALAKQVPGLVGQSPGISPGMVKLAFGPNQQLALSMSDGTMLIADWKKNNWMTKEFKSNEEKTSKTTVSPSGNELLVARASGRIEVWDLALDKPVVKFPFDGHAAAVTQIEFANDGATVVSGDESGRVISWDLATQKQLNVFDEFRNKVLSISTDEDLVSATDGQVLLRGRAGVGKGKYTSFGTRYSKAWVSNSGGKVAVFKDGRIHVYDRSSLKLLETIKPTGFIDKLVFSKDDKMLFINDGKFVSQWDWKSGTRVGRYDAGVSKLIFEFEVSDDGKYLAFIEGKGVSKDIRVFEIKR